MRNLRGGGIIALTTILCLSITSLATTAKRVLALNLPGGKVAPVLEEPGDGFATNPSGLIRTIAQTPDRKTRNSPILPYLLDNPHDNSTVRVRCLPRERQEADGQRQMIRDSLLQPTPSYPLNTVTIEIEGSCRHVRVRVQDNSDFLDPPIYHPSEFDDDWLNREGSGWYWQKHGR